MHTDVCTPSVFATEQRLASFSNTVTSHCLLNKIVPLESAGFLAEGGKNFSVFNGSSLEMEASKNTCLQRPHRYLCA
jgi:hypothetical protein